MTRTPDDATLVPDLPVPPVPGFDHDEQRLPLDVAAGHVPVLAAVAAVLARHTGLPEISLGTTDVAHERSVRVRIAVAGEATLTELLDEASAAVRAAQPSAEPLPVVVLPPSTAPDRQAEAAAKLVDRDLVLMCTGEVLRCHYDKERYRPDTVHRLLSDIRAVLAVLADQPATPVHELVLATPRAERPVPQPAGQQPQLPVGGLERAIGRIWADVLGVADIGRDENFFALGGHSVLAAHAAARLRERFDVDLPLDLLFGDPTVRAAAQHVMRERSARRSVPVDPPRRRPAGAEPVLSFSQERIWFFEQWKPGTAAYHQPWALQLDGVLDVDALSRALDWLMRRHDVLRTTFVSEAGRPRPVCHPDMSLAVRRHDLTSVPAALRRDRAEEILLAGARELFDLAAGPLVRADLLRLSSTEHVLLLTLHHLVNDGASLEVLLRELAQGYDAFAAGAEPDLPEPALRYSDIAAWQRRVVEGTALQDAVEYVKNELRDAPALLTLPTDRPRPAAAGHSGASFSFDVTEDVTYSVRQLSRELGVTPFVTMLAAFQAVLHRYTGQDTVVVGTTTANRDRPETSEVAGPLFNTVALRADLAGDPAFRDLVDQVRRRSLGAFARQEIPFEVVVDHVDPVRDPSHSPLFQVLFELAEPPHGTPPSGLSWSSRLIDTGTSKLDLTLTFTADDKAFSGLATFNTDLFDRSTIARLVQNFLALLGDACANPSTRISALALCSIADHELYSAVNDTSSGRRDDRCVHELFEEQAAHTPDAIAVRCGDVQLSYAALNTRANQVAWRLREAGVGPETLVGLCVDRSADLLVAMLGILKSGGAYVPIDPGDPVERKRGLAATAKLLVGSSTGAAAWYEGRIVGLEDEPGDRARADNPPHTTEPGNLAYVIHTSGSTGAPKGVLVQHDGLVNYLRWCTAQYVADGTGGAPVFSSAAFDMVFPSLYAPLVNGQTVHIVPSEVEVGDLGGHLASAAPYAFVKLTPGHLELLLHQFGPEEAAGLCETLVVGADAFPSRALAAWRRLAPDMVVLNEYGPTEASVGNSVLRSDPRLDPGDEISRDLVPIGRPIFNTTMYVLDRWHRMVPVGVPGELYIGGDCVVRGYLGLPGLTAERFVPDPYATVPGARMYRTGDLGRLLANGDFEFLGRIDTQVKIDGFRIEPGEIEGTLSRHPAIRQAAVIPVGDKGSQRLVAYAVAEHGHEVSERSLREFLGDYLPRHMMPSSVVLVDAIPLNANGKVDRSALPHPVVAAPQADAPQESELSNLLRRTWSLLLDRPPQSIGVDDDFFRLGGRSLDVVRLAAQLRDTLRVDIPVARLFRASSMAAMAEVVLAHEHRPGESERIARALRRMEELTPEQKARLLEKRRTGNGAST